MLVLADRPAGHGLLLELQVGRRIDRWRLPPARRQLTSRRPCAKRRIAGNKLRETGRTFAWLPDLDIADMAGFFRAAGLLLVVVDEIAGERRLVLRPDQRHV